MSTFFSDETYGTARRTEYSREARKWYREHGLCPTCGGNRDSEYLYCLACRRRNADYQRNTAPSERTRESRRRTALQWYYNKKAKGVCTKCGERQAVAGKTRCAICAGRQDAKAKVKRAEKAVMKDPLKCFFCGKSVIAGKKVCQKHYDMCMANLVEATAASRTKRKDHVWKMDNKLIARR